MKIGITLYPYGEKKPAGLGRAIFELIKALLEIDKDNEYTIFLKNPSLNPDLPGSNWKAVSLTPNAVRQIDVCIFNTPVTPWWYGIFGSAKKSVVIAYDFAYLRNWDGGENVEKGGSNSYPSPFPITVKGRGWGMELLRLVHNRALKKVDLIISISEATKKDLINIFKIPEEKIKVVYLGFNNICNNLAVRPLSWMPEKFFLFVGAIKERKNVHGIVEAFNLFNNSSNFPRKLIIAGNGSGEYFEKIKFIAGNSPPQPPSLTVREGGEEEISSPLGGRVIFLGQITDAKLSYLYQRAEALVYPSFIEGFGFPILEAQACGLPVITSNTFSLPEVAGDGAILVDPSKPSEIAEAMKKICQDPNFRRNLIEKGFLNSKKFSWQKTAQEILKVL